ncbi:MAG: TetR/AcrR family transcriptional regulator, partial [Anaerolineae bacterium]|nr:TetR/AcrR family transcriptional regulator [Anaerolineae bacterium]
NMMQADGAASLSFNAIARQLGIKPPSLYTYFDSKHAIYDEIFRRGWQLFLQQMDILTEQEGTAYEKLVRYFETYMRFAQENPDYYQIMFQRPIPDFVPSEESLAVSFGSLDRFTTYLQEILHTEGIDPGVPYEQARDIIIALSHGLTEQHLANNPELPVGEGRYGSLIHQAVTVLLKAWAKVN